MLESKLSKAFAARAFVSRVFKMKRLSVEDVVRQYAEFLSRRGGVLLICWLLVSGVSLWIVCLL